MAMAKISFSQQIEYLLFTGSIEGEVILKLHLLLKSYRQREISSEDMQLAIDAFDPDKYPELGKIDGSSLLEE